MKKDDVKYTICTEGSDYNFPYLRVMLLSLLKHSPWLKDNIIVMTCELTPLSKHNREVLKDICQNIQFYEIDPSYFSNIPIKSSDKAEVLLSLYKIFAFNMKGMDLVIYMSSFNLCISDIPPLFKGNSDIILANHVTQVTKVKPVRKTIKQNNPYCDVMMISDKCLNDSIFNGCLDNLKREVKITKTAADGLIFKALNFNNHSIDYWNNNQVVKKSKYNDSKYKNFLAIKRSVCIINMDIELNQRSKTHSYFMFKKINFIWKSYNEQGDWNTSTDSNEIEAKPIQEYIRKRERPHGLPEMKIDKSENKLSIIIPAYKAEHYIEQCLNSITNQRCETEVEILIGIDNCRTTLSKLSSIKSRYPNLRVYFSKQSVGPYIIRNTLIEMASYDNILFFDADDIMLVNMIDIIFRYHSPETIIRFKYYNFNHGSDYNIHRTKHKDIAHGVFFAPRKVLDKIGGFQPWICAADTEFMERCKRNRVREIRLGRFVFYRRIHKQSLTQNGATSYRSKVRLEKQRFIKNNKKWNIPIPRKKVSLEEI